LNEAASALKDDCFGFRLGAAMIRVKSAFFTTLWQLHRRWVKPFSGLLATARLLTRLSYSNREANSLNISLSYSGVPRHSDRQQMEFCMFAAIRICPLLTGQKLVLQHFSIAHYRLEGITEMSRFVGTTVQFAPTEMSLS
jgi:hypothetical protein